MTKGKECILCFEPNWIKLKGVRHPQACTFCCELKGKLTGEMCDGYGYRTDEIPMTCFCNCHKRFPY